MANPPRPSTSSKWKLRSQNTPVDHSPIHIPPTDTSAVQRPKVLATVRDSNPAGLTGVTSQGTNPTQFSQPQVAPQPAQVTTGQDPVSPAKRTRRRKIAPDKAGQSKPSDTAAADNERRVKARIAPTDDLQAPTQTTTGNPFVAAIESAVTLSGDAFTDAKIEFLALPVTSKACVEQYMLGCKILAQYAKAELAATDQVHCGIFWKGLEKLHLGVAAARQKNGDPLPGLVLPNVKTCAFDENTPREITLQSARAMVKLDESKEKKGKEKKRGRDTRPERTAAWAITALGLKSPLKDAQKAEDFHTRQDPSWSVLLEKLRNSASEQATRATTEQEAQVYASATAQPEAEVMYRVGQHDVKSNSPAGKIIKKLLAKTLSSEDAKEYYLDRWNDDEKEVAIYVRIVVLLMLYFEARESESEVDVVDIFFHGVRTLANDLSRAAQKGRDVTKMLEAIKSELNGAHLPLKVSEIGDGCMRRDRKALVSNLKHGLKPIVHGACDTTPRPERLTHEQLLDMCRPQAPLRAPTPVFTTTTTVTTLANTTATAAVDTAVAGFDDDTWLPDEFR